jgi:membrane protein DedA with SNARE-associated domain
VVQGGYFVPLLWFLFSFFAEGLWFSFLFFLAFLLAWELEVNRAKVRIIIITMVFFSLFLSYWAGLWVTLVHNAVRIMDYSCS